MAFEDRIRLPALNLIHRRSRLLNMLAEFVESGKRLVTIYAPGGYGKSILLADFAQTTDLPVCWCSLEPTDRDPTSFLILLAHSITDRFHDIEPNGLFKLIARGDTQASIHRIAELLGNAGPHLIIIDDYHKAVSAGMTLALNRLLEQLPETSIMVIAARGNMELETGQVIDLLISERAAGLSEEELRFTGHELQRVMLKRFGRRIDLESANEIARATDGNIAQILLTGHITHTERIISNLHQQLGSDRDLIYSYLAEEVFDKLAADMQRFLLHTSIFPEITAPLCNELLETTEAEIYLKTLSRDNLFITRVGNSYRYHDLFVEFLRGKLAEDETTHRQVTIKAAKLLANCERYEDAVNLFLSVQAWTEAAYLLESRGTLFYDTGRALTLNNWLAEISGRELSRHPRLLLLKGKILNDDLGEPGQAMTFYQQAEAAFRQQNDPIGAAETQMLRSTVLRMTGRAIEAVAVARSALAQLEDLEADERIMAWAIRTCGIAYGASGNISEALVHTRRALEKFEALDDTYSVARCHHEIGVDLVAQGNVQGADHHYRQAIRIWESLGNASDLANVLNSLGVSLESTGHYQEALKYFGESLDIALQIGSSRRAAFAQAGIGDAHLGLEAYEKAIEAYHLSTRFARQAQVRRLEIYNQIKIGECHYQLGELTQALTMANQAQEVAAEIGLAYEKGLAILLQARIYVQRDEYAAGLELFARALASFAENDVLEQAKVRLGWGHCLWLDLKTSAAFEQLQEAIRLALGIGELIGGLGPVVLETKALLLHFLHRADTPAGLRDNILFLLDQSPRSIEIAKPSLQVFAFGAPALIVAGERRQFSQRGKIRKLPEFLLYLILEGQNRGCRWSEVSAAIWPEVLPEKASVSFHQNLKRLRDVIFEAYDYITVQDDYYRVNPLYLDWCDALAFEKLFERAATAPVEESLALQLELVNLYQGEFLAGFELGEWGSPYRTKCETRFLQVAGLAAEQLLEYNEPREALTVINKGLTQDHYQERLHRLALKAYDQLGLHNQLAAYYEELERMFEQELGAPPEPDTEELYRQLLDNR